MKKFLVGIAAAAIITIPMTSFALESMSKGALKKATGQAGVSIALDDIVIYQKSNPTTTYWDADGTTAYRVNPATMDAETSTVGGALRTGIEISYSAQSEKVIVIDGILDNSKYGVTQMKEITGRDDIGIMASGQWAAGNVITDGVTTATALGTDGFDAFDPATGQIADNAGLGYLNSISPLTIDVGTCESLSAGLNYNLANGTGLGDKQVAGVVIGLPTIEIQTFHKDNVKSIKLVSDTVSGTTELANIADGETRNEFIQIQKSGHSTMAILGGRLEIAPH